MKIIKFPKENIAIIKHEDSSVNVQLDKLQAAINDPEKLKINMLEISNSNRNRDNL